jgi:two-component system, NtrC family, sensor histidine kinase HydH
MNARFLKRIRTRSFMFSSPWLLAAAAGLLIMIVVTFAFHNLRLEERLMTNAMLQKAGTLMRVLHSGARASHLNDLRRDFWNNDPWNVHVQRVIDHLGEDPELCFVALVDGQGKVIAHSNHAKVGVIEPVPMDKAQLQASEEQPQITYRIEDTADFGRVFEAVRPFTPLFPTLAPLPIRPSGEGRKDSKGPFFHGPERDRPLFRLHPESLPPGVPFYVVVGLDMKEFDRTVGRLRMQIFMLSLAMLLVGLGGWFSLLTVQGFRVSQKTIDDIQAFTSLLIAKLPVGVIAVDGSGRITTWNGAVSQLTGIDKSAALGKQPEEILPEQLAAFFVGKEAVSHDDTVARAEISVRLLLGDRRSELLCHSLTITDTQRQYMGKVLLISDVTEIKSLEQRMRESERLAAIGRMAGGVAHEVRNPLSSIKGLALLLKNKFPTGSKEQTTADLLIQETERMNRTITEMLSFTRPSALKLAPVDLANLLRRSLELVKAEAADNRIAIELDVQPGLEPILGDVDRLQQVVMNVVLNALQAMEYGGALTVKLSNSADRRGVELRISDTGVGVSPELLSQVFYPYFTTKPSGTGIGLAISQKIVADHGGTIDMESEPGKGTTVIIQLPAQQSLLME